MWALLGSQVANGRIVTHVQSSSHAQGYLRALTELLQGEDRKSSLESVSFSPTRFVSHAGPASTLVKSFPEVVQFLTHLKLEGDQGQRVWCHTLQALDLKLWVVLAGIADLLGILNSANIATQRKNLRILEVDAIVESVKGSLAEYIRAGRSVCRSSQTPLSADRCQAQCQVPCGNLLFFCSCDPIEPRQLQVQWVIPIQPWICTRNR